MIGLLKIDLIHEFHATEGGIGSGRMGHDNQAAVFKLQ